MFRFDERLLSGWTKRWVTVSAIAGILSTALNIALFSAIGWSIQMLINAQAILTPNTALIAIGLVFGKGILASLERYAASQASADTKVAVRETIYAHALRLGPGGLNDERTGELVNMAVDGMDWLELYFGVYWAQFIVGMVAPILVIGYIAFLDGWSALLLLFTLPLPPLVLGLTSKNFKAVSERYFAASNRLSAQFLDSLQGLTTLKIFNQGKARGEQFRQENEALRQETMRLLAVNQLMLFVVDAGFALATTTTLTLLALWRLSAGAISAGAAITFILLSIELARPLNLIGQFFFAGAIGRSVANKISSFLDMPVAASQPAIPQEISRAPLEIRFEGVKFVYPGREDAALDHLSITIQPGERVAFVGPSGAGKSTVFQLLLRFYDAQAGTILLNGIPLSDIPVDQLREHIAFVSQDPYLFYGTLEENLRVARPNATPAQLSEAIHAAHLDEVVQNLPDGLNTIIGERGLTLSGGQAQRLAFARAFLKDAPLVLLDEPTSNLDSQTEAIIQDSVERLQTGKTVIMIAHRLSTARRAERVFVIERGQAIASGTPSAVFGNSDFFIRLSKVEDGSAE